MEQRIYVIYDKVALQSGPVFEARNDGVAYRNFKRFLDNEVTVEYVDDYKLLFVGSINHDSSELVPEIPPQEVGPTFDMVDQIEEENQELGIG